MAERGDNGGAVVASTELAAAALAYAERGWRVFPVRRDKTPLTRRGFKDATDDASVIRGWWKRWPDGGVAVATGSESGLVVRLNRDNIR